MASGIGLAGFAIAPLALGSFLTVLPFTVFVGLIAAYFLGTYFRSNISISETEFRVTNFLGSVRFRARLADLLSVDEQSGESSYLRLHFRGSRMVTVTESLRDYQGFAKEVMRFTGSPEA